MNSPNVKLTCASHQPQYETQVFQASSRALGYAVNAEKRRQNQVDTIWKLMDVLCVHPDKATEKFSCEPPPSEGCKIVNFCSFQ